MNGETPEAAPSATSGFRGIVDLLGNARFRWLFFSNMAFFTAMMSQSVVRAVLTWELTGDEFKLGQVMAAMAIPMAVIAPFGGVMADRVDRRRLIATGQSIILCSELVVLALLVTGVLQFVHLLLASVVMGSVFPLIMPARQAIVANLVGREGLSRAIALNMAGMNATNVIGPAVGGALDAIGHEVAYGAGVAMYGIAVLCLIPIGRSPAEGHVREVSIGRNLVDGFRYLGENRLLLSLLLFGLVPMFLMMPFRNMLVVFVTKVWEQGRFEVGLMNTFMGFGGIAGALFVAWIGDYQRRLFAMVSCLVAFAVLLSGFALAPSYVAAIPFVLAASAFSNVFSTLNNTAVQLLIPDEVRGRVSSFLMMSFSLPMVGVLPIGYLARLYGVQVAVVAASVGAVAIAVVMLASSARLRSMDGAVRDAISSGASPPRSMRVR